MSVQKTKCPECNGHGKFIDYVKGSTHCDICDGVGYVMPYREWTPPEVRACKKCDYPNCFCVVGK
jgi:DnaJ-class molecular chaperone